ncbi:hypothetical protein EV175_003936 [Coemansia sp. RSA 1933]|nr:hypothetical protein EV175_003936 [Coemansia sp. RSA 1933]
MPPRKGHATGKPSGKSTSKHGRPKQSANGLRVSRHSTDTDTEQNMENDSGAHTPPLAPPSAMKVRSVMTPLVGGRKYARGQADPGTPQRTDVMRVAVSHTPYTARRGISEYEADKDPIKTYIRLKPGTITMAVGIDRKEVPRTPLLQVVSDKAVEVARAVGDDVNERYLFTGVVPSVAQQARVFEVCAAPVVRDLAAGFNTLLFTFGVSNSGKTYTVQGTPGAPGMLPRSVKALLDVLDDRGQQGDFPLRPRYATQVEYCSDPRVVSPTFRVAPGEDSWASGLDSESAGIDSAQMAAIAQALDSDGERSEWVYQVYVSYFEIYNEMVYDLLDLATLTTVHVGDAVQKRTAQQTRAGGRKGARKRGAAAPAFNDDPSDPLLMCPPQIAALPRTALIVRASGGRRNEAFVDGVTEVRVRTTRDLVRVLAHGQMRRAVHATGLNAGSSRSHALFQAKLVKVRRDAQVVPMAVVPAAARASVRTMTVVDLAGSERAKRTLNQGDRLTEAGKINVGLMTLKKCLDVRRFNATAADAAQLVPYNESKVTRLFQPALEGGAKTVMVVCVDPYEPPDADAAHALAETKGVLDFARVASELVTKVAKVEDPEEPELSTSRLSMYEDDEDDDDDDEEVFFDSRGRRSTTATRKRTGSAVDMDARLSVGSADDDIFDAPRPPPPATSKRQRNDLGGAWQHPPPPSAAASIPRVVMRPPPVPPTAQTARNKPVVQIAGTSSSSPFSFEVPAARVARDSPVALTRTLQQQQQQQNRQTGDAALRVALADARAQLAQLTRERDAEVEELATYAEHLEAAVAELRERYRGAQERALAIENATRAEVSAFFVQAIGRLQSGAADRLHDELVRSEAKAAHKIDILSRLRVLRGDSDSEDDDGGAEASVSDSAHVPTVSPRTATRRAMSRKASRKANKFTSISAGEHAEIANLRLVVESLEAQVSSQRTQLEMVAQARTADRAGRDTLEAALVDANARGATLEARLLRATSAHSREAEVAVTQAHERERSELVAQIDMLRTQLRDAETQAMRARRRWETQELLPLQERLRVLMDVDHEEGDVDERIDRVVKQKDDAMKWWMKEQARVSQVNAQNDVLMREIRHLRTRLRDVSGMPVASAGQPQGGNSPRHSIHTESTSDGEDGSFCKISLRSVDSLEAINGGNPIGVSSLGLMPAAQSMASMPTSQNSLTSPIRALDRVVSKGRVLHRNPPPHGFGGSESSDSFGHPMRSPSGTAQQQQAGRAKRVVSRVFNKFAHDARRKPTDQPQRPPYMAGRFAHTDSAIGNFSTQVLSFTDAPVRSRGNTVDSVDSADPVMQPRVRSTVYSGPIVSHASGGVSVTFTSEEIHDLPIDAVAGDDGDEVMADVEASKRSHSAARKPGYPVQVHEEPIAEVDEDDRSQSPPPQQDDALLASSVPDDPSSSSLGAVDAQATIKKKRKLHTGGRTMLNVASPDNDTDNRLIGAPPLTSALIPQRGVSKAAVPQENKQPVLFTPVRVRANSKNNIDEDEHEHMLVPPPGSTTGLDGNPVDGHGESIFLTPMKMLSRLRNRKK